MKFLLLKTLLLRRAKDEGFTLPVVIAIGLVMILLSTVNMIQSGEETLLTLSKKGSSNALASAEFGIARYRELLNNNRVLAVYNLDQWTNANVSGQICDDISGTGGWADDSSSTWRNVSLNETTFSVDFNDDGDQTDTNVVIGEYKIVDYIYDNDNNVADDDNGEFNLFADANTDDDDPLEPNYQTITNENDIDDDGQSDAKGLLTLKGRSTDGSEAQIQVEIPLGVNTDDLESLDPGLWIRQSSLTNFGNITLNSGNVVLYKASSGSNRCDNVNISGITAIRDPRNLPPIVNLAGLTVRTLEGDISTEQTTPTPTDQVNYFNDGEIILGTGYDDDSSATQASNTVDEVERYYYTTGAANLVIDNGESMLADGTSKVILYVGGDLDINTVNGPTNLIRLGNSSNIATSRYLEIHVNGNVTIDGDGDLEITGLLHVPNGTVTISESARVNVTGSIWANNWDNTSSGTVTVDTDDYKFYSITPDRTPKPLTYRPTNWETQEVQ